MNVPQLRAMLWLRWTLTRRQWRRGDAVGAALSIIFLVIGACVAVAAWIGGFLGGLWGLSHASPVATMLVWDGIVLGFLFFWMMGLVTELQRSEIIDLTRLMHLPVSLRDAFLLNYLASHLSMSLAIVAPAVVGLILGTAIGRGAAIGLLFPAAFGFFFMVTAWTYHLRGWIAALMVNKRRRRAIVAAVTMIFVLISQVPNLAINVFGVGRRHAQHGGKAAHNLPASLHVIETIHRYVPPLWLPQGASALSSDHVAPALWGALGMIALGAWGFSSAYRSTIRFYRGGEGSRVRAAPKTRAPSRRAGRNLIERKLPVVSDEVSALALAGVRSISRAAEVKMALATNVLILGVVGVSFLLRTRGVGAKSMEAALLLATVVVAATFFVMAQLMLNQYGFDRNGFRALVLSPTPRRNIVLGKGLAMLPVALAVFVFNLAIVTILARLGVVPIALACLDFAAAWLVMSVLGGTVSIVAPYRVASGSMKPTKTRGTTQLFLVLVHLLFPVLMIPIFLPAGFALLAGRLEWMPGWVAALSGAVLMTTLAAALYTFTLAPLGRLLQRREQAILQIVTQEVE